MDNTQHNQIESSFETAKQCYKDATLLLAIGVQIPNLDPIEQLLTISGDLYKKRRIELVGEEEFQKEVKFHSQSDLEKLRSEHSSVFIGFEN